MDARARFEAKYTPEPNTGCWLWTGATRKNGYGAFWFGGRLMVAHRFAYAEFVGPIPEGLHVLHRCDQPSCVNPNHLFLGTNDGNMADRNLKCRQARGERTGGAKLTASQVLEIRATQGETQERIAKRFGVSDVQISNIMRGKHWKHVP